MLDRLRSRRPSHTTVVAYLALFLAVGGGTAFAIVGNNQVKSESIIDGEVKTPDLGTNSVGSGKIKPEGVHNSDLANSSVGTGKVVDGSLSGADIDEGSLSGVNATTLDSFDSSIFLRDVIPITEETAHSSSAMKERFVNCGSGRKVVGGGAQVVQVDASDNPVLSTNQDVNLVLVDSAPVVTSTNQLWYARGVETDSVGANWYLYVTALCARTG